MRKAYRNGDEISLTATGCDGCSPSMINRVLCHERGCPDAWRDTKRACFECGCDFYLGERGQRTCNDCLADYAEAENERQLDARGFGVHNW